MSGRLPFPGAVGLTHLRVYDETTPDGLAGGSPHVHLISSEVYVPTRGSGSVETYSSEGVLTYDLAPGGLVWFEPGVIHRLVNASGDLEIFVAMQNAGLPEAGDAVFTFPAAVMDDIDAYVAASTLPEGTLDARRVAAIRRRDLALEGFRTLVAGGPEALEAFYLAALAVRRHLADEWDGLLVEGGESAAKGARDRLEAFRRDDPRFLLDARRASTPVADSYEGIGMCGTLRQYDLLAEKSRSS